MHGAMMEDTKKLETLSNEPHPNNYVNQQKAIERLASNSRDTMGFNSAVIKPETRVNKTESAEESLEQPKSRTCLTEQAHLINENDGVLANPEPSNQNLKIIEEIEGLISQVNEKLDILNREWASLISENKYRLMVKISQAVDEIDLFQKTTLFELRKAFK